ncbi:hypothetical protein NUM3379_35120 [Kineococcus sp. NUM-3379]
MALDKAAHAAEVNALRVRLATSEHRPLAVLTPATYPYARSMIVCSCGWKPTADEHEAWGWDSSEQFAEHAPASARLIPVATYGDGYVAAGLDWYAWSEQHPDRGDPFAPKPPSQH